MLYAVFCQIVEKHKANTKVEDESVTGEKPVRYMVEDMLACGMTDNEIYSEMATFLVAVSKIEIMHICGNHGIRYVMYDHFRDLKLLVLL